MSEMEFKRAAHAGDVKSMARVIWKYLIDVGPESTDDIREAHEDFGVEIVNRGLGWLEQNRLISSPYSGEPRRILKEALRKYGEAGPFD